MIDVMGKIFERLIEFSIDNDDYDVEYDIIESGRYIATKDDKIDEKYLKETKLVSEVFFFNPNESCFFLKYSEEIYFVIITSSNIKSIPYFLKQIKENVGLLTSAIYHSGVIIKKDIQKNAIYNDIAYQYMGQEDYEGHDIEEILKVLEPIYVFRLDEYSLKKPSLNRILGSVISLNHTFTLLEYNQSTLDEFSNSFQFGSEIIPHENLINALLSNSYEHCFLELYKCIESLFQVNYALELFKETAPNCTLLEFIEALEKNLKWRPTEHITIKKIFKNSPEYILENFRKISGKDKSGEKLGEWFYEIRNQIVHLKQIHKKVKFKSIEWNSIFYSTLLLIEFWFKKYELEFLET